MAQFFKWWKNKTALSIIITAILSVVISFLFAYFFSWGWLVSIAIAIGGGLLIRYFLIKALKKYSNEIDNMV